ncbi:MAG: EthD family reductase [Sphingomonadales bacterium]
MHKLMALYRTPPDPDHFRNYYETVHIPLVRKMPGIVRMNYSFDVHDFGGGSPFFCIFECYFENVQDMIASAQTPEGQVVTADVPNCRPGEVEIVHFPVVDA